MADSVDPADETPSASFLRVLSLIDGLPAEFKPADDTPLREAMPGGWPTIGEYRAFMAEQTLDKPARIGGIVFRAGVKISTVIASAQRLYEHSPAPPPSPQVVGWQSMETAPLDGKHCILAIKTGCFVYSIQGAFMSGKWMNAGDIKGEPLAWMPNILLPDEFCPWTDAFKARAALATSTEVGE